MLLRSRPLSATIPEPVVVRYLKRFMLLPSGDLLFGRFASKLSAAKSPRTTRG